MEYDVPQKLLSRHTASFPAFGNSRDRSAVGSHRGRTARRNRSRLFISHTGSRWVLRRRRNLLEATLRESAFCDWTLDEVRSVDAHARLLALSKNEWLFMEGDPRRHVYYLSSGRIKISRLSTEGKEFILDLIERGEVFGEGGLLEDGPQDSFGLALEDSAVIAISIARFMEILERRPELMLELAKLVSQRKKRMETRLASIALKRVRGRVATLLLQLSQDYGVRNHRGIALEIRLRQQEMGSLIGASREIVSQTLADFRRRGLIHSDGRRITILEAQTLEEI